MPLREFHAAIGVFDKQPPLFRPNAERSRAFEKIGRFLEQHARAGQVQDMKHAACGIWPPVRERLDRAARQAAETQLRRHEVCLWQMYNSGLLVKSDDVAFGLDLVTGPREFGWDTSAFTLELAAMLDLLLVTHRHHDHFDRDLVAACLRLGKPVVMPSSVASAFGCHPNLHSVDHGWEWEIDDLFIRARTGVHTWRDHVDDVHHLYYEIRCQEGYTLLFGGDIDYTKAFEKTSGVDIDLLCLPWRNPNKRYEDGHPDQTASTIDAVRIAIERVQPRAILYEHCGELEHVYGGFPPSYDIALDLQKRIAIPSELLFWGESISLTNRQ